MKEIKFRVWGKGQMWYKETKTADGNETILQFFAGGIGWGLYDAKLQNRIVTGDPKAIFNMPGELMQYTGLKDKNGKEIYEGDILEHSIDKMFLKWLVEFNVFRFEIVNIAKGGDLFQRFPIDSIYYFTDREIIGNIYENPKLLDKKTTNLKTI